MEANVLIIEKLENGELKTIDERTWNTTMLAMMEHANFLLVGGKEYEMIEGRLDVENQKLEVLVLPINKAIE
ncbi:MULTISPECIES: hypothetical protein [Paenibacillus]|uniref:hypothetical protein n=1 Tax=Paenibacillus TaxID=44249 RepID=UPI00020D671C|nr:MULTISPECIES: hypothetical protein [Paenibacillus]EGL15399.1 hypothetical protein HMPREF9413_3967 [Paenibacillus sp. HGF7]EPD82850.1 hypothetical protein HMPREF1207_03642 [Paenibacillus sp. HGH0039]MBV6713787.1 hypothetical protein [Paenibacillus chitinolyticus]